MSAHPSNELLHRFVEGELSPAESVEVRTHVLACAECQKRREAALDSLKTAVSGVEITKGPAAPSAPTDPEKPAEKLPLGPLGHGTVVGRYTILDQLGSGGMGVVYSAYDPKLDRKIALKFLTVESSRRTEAVQARFLREAQAMAHLSHPNVINVHDVGTLGEDVFIAMEFVDGSDLKGWLKDKPRTWREVVDVMVAAGRGLAAAHAAGLIHRDIKPSNILVGQDGRPRVMDFGLARSIEGQEPSDSDLKVERESALDETITVAGSVMGTPQYMAPEQRRARRSTGARTSSPSASPSTAPCSSSSRSTSAASTSSRSASRSSPPSPPPPARSRVG